MAIKILKLKFTASFMLVICTTLALTVAPISTKGQKRGRAGQSKRSRSASTNMPSSSQVSKKRLSAEAEAATREALKSLREVASATEIDVTFEDYKNKIITAKAASDEAQELLPEGELKQEIELAIQSYIDMSVLWREYIEFQRTDRIIQISREATLAVARGRGQSEAEAEAYLNVLRYGPRNEAITNLVKKYSIPSESFGTEGWRSIKFNNILAIWNIARQHLIRASDLFHQ